MRNLFRNRGQRITGVALLLISLLMLPLGLAAGDYIGPQNRIQMVDGGTYTLRTCSYNGSQYCSCIVDGGECDVTDHPCGDWRGGCSESTRSRPDVPVDLPHATVSGTYTCAVPSANGWCRSGANLALSASEPVAGYVIQYIEGNSGVLCNPADAAAVSCNYTPPQGDNTITFWAHSSFGDTSTAQTINSIAFDSSAPTAGISIPAPNGSNGWFRSNVVATASGMDGVSGIAALNVRLDGGAWQANGSAFSSQGAHTVQGRAVDNAGNEATSTTLTFNLDSVAPSVTSSIPAATGANGWFNAPVTLGVNGVDATSGMAAAEIRTGTGAWVANTSTISADGSHSVTFRSTDRAGNVNTTTQTVRVDQTPPVASSSVTGTTGQNGWYTSTAAVSATSTDATSRIAAHQLRIDGGAWQTGAISVSDGTHTVEVSATDHAGNTNTASRTVRVDTVAPSLIPSYSAPDGDNRWYTSAVQLNLAGTDATSGLAAAEISVDGGAYQANSVTLDTEGVHSVTFRTRDNAGNQTTETAIFRVDLTGPTVSIVPSGTVGRGTWFVSDVSIAANAVDAVSGIASHAIRVDGGAWEPLGAAFTVSDGVHQIDVRSTDHAGNDTTVSRTISVDTLRPIVRETVPAPDGDNHWYVDPVDLAVAGTDETSGVARSEIRVDGGAWTADGLTLTGDGSHTVEFQVTDRAGNFDIKSYALQLDTQGPQETFAITSGTAGTEGWYTSPTVTAQVTVTDATAGVAKTTYKVDNGPEQSGTTVTLNKDGQRSIVFEYTDNAGNTTTTRHVIKVDSTDPVLTPRAEGKHGLSEWWTSSIDVFANPTDATSGIEKTEISINGGGWKPVDTVELTKDGIYTLDFRTSDNAGNVRTDKKTYKIDQTDPVCHITAPPAEQTLTGTVTVIGRCTDTGAGILAIEISTDGGKTWAVLPGKGLWTYTWDTVLHPGEVIVRAADKAGNSSDDERRRWTIVNARPKVEVQEEWLIWEEGELKVYEGDLPLTLVSISIADYQKRWPAREWEVSPHKIPQVITWDRRFANGVLAPPGDYAVRVTARDTYGREGYDEGKIRIPASSQPTVVIEAGTLTPTPTITTTPTMTATATRTDAPTSFFTPTTMATAQPTPLATRVAPAATVLPRNLGFLFWLLLALLGMLFCFGWNAVRDPRPQAIRRLAETVARYYGPRTNK